MVLADPGLTTVNADGVFERTYVGARTETATGLDVEPAKPLSPLYVATMLYVPVGSVVVVSMATPALLILTVASTVVPVEKVMVPVGLPDTSLEAIVAVRVALVPGGTGTADEMEEVSVVVVVTSATGTVNMLAVLLAKFASPL